MKIRTLFLSDTHLGSRHSQAKHLLAYLNSIKHRNYPEKIYLIGDFIDTWRIRGWNDDCSLVIRKLLSFVKRGTKIYYLAGNHDDFLRKYIHSGLEFGSVVLLDEAIHLTADGKRLLIMHGDQLDLAAKYKWLCRIGDIGYGLLITLNSTVNYFRRKLGYKNHWSISQMVKRKVKAACQFVSDYENHLMKYAEERHCNGVICGHIHTATIRETNGFLYCNTGDWVESCTWITENMQGEFQLHYYKDLTQALSRGLERAWQ